MPSLAVVVLLALVAYRATRLVTSDSLTAQPRSVLYRWAWLDYGEVEPAVARSVWRTYVYELFTCQQCVGVWASIATVGLYTWQVAPVGTPLAWWLTVLAVAGAQSALALVVERG